LRCLGGSGTIGEVDDEEASTLMLEALFDIRAMVSDVHEIVMRIEGEDNGEEEEEEDA
jgi:hypothetical protein